MAHFPLFELLKKVGENSQYRDKAFKRVIPWIFKFLVTAPFHGIDQLTGNRRIKKLELSEDPVFVLGHWRSGTSFLQYMLSLDTRFGYLNKFESIFPELFLNFEGLFKPAAESISNLMSTVNEARSVSSDWKDWSSPGELDIAQLAYCSPVSVHWGHFFPKEYDYYFDRYLYLDTVSPGELEQWKWSYDFLIRKLALKNANKPLIIKSPPNTARVKHLLQLYPNARFIYIHRNPHDVFYSNMKLWTMLIDWMAFQQISHAEIERMLINKYRKIVSRYIEERELIPEGNLIEIPFHQMKNEPLNILEEIYTQFSWTGVEGIQSRVAEMIGDNTAKGRSKNGHKYDPRITSIIEQEWQFAFREWGYPMISEADPTLPDMEA